MPGKPLVDICGKPMIWWVYQNLKQVDGIQEVYIATDSKEIVDVCDSLEMKSVLTSQNHPTHLDRLSEFAGIIDADFYININGDEPLMLPEYIQPLIPQNEDSKQFYAANAMTRIKLAIDIVDVSKIKIVTDVLGFGMYMARTPIPYPKGSSDFEYMKFVGIQCFSRDALLFCAKTPRGPLESIEDINEYRFLENGKKIKFIETEAETISVDTKKDVVAVRKEISNRIKNGFMKGVL